MSVDAMIEATIGREGAYSNHPSDRGGETMWGITVAVARRNGYSGEMRRLPRDEAKRIYRREYYEKPGFAEVEKIDARVAEELFDTGVNMGPSIPCLMLQRLLNGLNRQGRDWPDLRPDGDIGPATLSALRSFVRVRGARGVPVLLKGLNCLQGARYVELAEGRAQNEDFLYGWLANRV